MKKVFVVVLHYKGRKYVRQCLQSLKKAKAKNFSLQVVVVDNKSPEPIVDFPKKYPDYVLIKNKENLGFVEGNNVGIRYSLKKRADYVIFLNNDTYIDPQMIVCLIEASESNKKAGLLAPKIYFAPEYEYHHNRYKKSERGKVFWYAGGEIDWKNVITQHRGVDEVDKGQYDQTEETDYISGCCLLVKREVLKKIGLLDKKYFAYYEDSDFSVRAKKAGFKLLYVPQAKMWHFNAGSSEVGGSLHDYYITRNRLLFGIRYAPLRAKIALFRWGLSRLIVGRPWQKIAFRDFLIGRFEKGSYEA